MERIGFILCAVSLAFLLNPFQESQAQSKQSILILADEWTPMHQLASSIRIAGTFQIDNADQNDIPADLSPYAFILMYVHKTLVDHVETALINYTKNGGRLIVLHHGLASAKMGNPDWMKFMEVELFPREDLKYRWKVLADTTHAMINLYPGHFITTEEVKYEYTLEFESEYFNAPKGTYQAFDLLNTEIFLNQRFTDGSERNLLFGFSTEGRDLMQPTSGWYKKTGDGWLFYYQAGHNREDFANANFSQVILNTLRWEPE